MTCRRSAGYFFQRAPARLAIIEADPSRSATKAWATLALSGTNPIAGDALVTLDMTRGRTGPQIIRGPVTEDPDLALQSLDVLAATDAETVLPGHGDPWLQGVKSAADIARSRR